MLSSPFLWIIIELFIVSNNNFINIICLFNYSIIFFYLSKYISVYIRLLLFFVVIVYE